MSNVPFPFWIVTRRRGSISKPVELVEALGIIAAFTTAENASTFMVSRGETEWENRLVARATVGSLVADLRRMGARGVCLDPGGDQSGPTFALEDLDAC